MIRWQETVRSESGESFPQRGFARGRGTGNAVLQGMEREESGSRRRPVL
jgi:hypothetical protein